MPLSVSKLQDFISSKGFVTNKFFTLNEYLFYVEIFCLKSADTFLLYIPSKYEIETKDEKKCFKVKYIDMTNSDNLPDEYAGEPNNTNIQNAYGNNIHFYSDTDKIEQQLENNYKHSISLKDISIEDTNDIKAIYRQLKRLKYSVQNIEYKLAVLYQNYLCTIRRDDSITCLSIKHFPRNPHKQLMIVTDLENFYEKFEKIPNEIKLVRQSIYHVLERNQTSHGQLINKIIENKKDINEIPALTEQKKLKYISLISQLEQMLEIVSNSEIKILEELYNINNNITDNLQNDIQKIHRKTSLEKEIDNINSIKGSISKYINILRQKTENSILSIDKIMFDNTVMFDCMVKNFAKLKQFC